VDANQGWLVTIVDKIPAVGSETRRLSLRKPVTQNNIAWLERAA